MAYPRTHRPPTREGTENGLAYLLWLPETEPPWPGVVIVHGAGSRKENHADFGRACSASGWAAVAYDQRGHGASEDEMGPDAVTDAVRMARLLAGTEGVDGTRVCVINLIGQLDHVATPHLEVPALVHAAVQRVDGRARHDGSLGGRGHVGQGLSGFTSHRRVSAR